ncbi:transposase [Streptomyces sp. NPDC090798]|uniref:transposase n=1 Tax=Streptomyces sp. NPDC090798 TaxID=3365968 RepID=UPI0038091880
MQYVIFRLACHRSMVWTLGNRCRSDVRDSLNSGMSMRTPYSRNAFDERWLLAEPVITAWKVAHPSVSGHQRRYAMPEIVNAILYQNRSGCQWDLLPHDLPPAGAVKYYFYKWRDDGTDQTVHDLLRWQLRERNWRLADPSLRRRGPPVAGPRPLRGTRPADPPEAHRRHPVQAEALVVRGVLAEPETRPVHSASHLIFGPPR